MLKRNNYLLFLWLPAIFILGGLATYSEILGSFFVSDDFAHIYRAIEHGLFSAFLRRCSFFYRPMVTLSLFIDYKMWGLNPVGYHLINIILHSLNSFLVFLTCLLLLKDVLLRKDNEFRIALCAAFLFLVIPSHAEAVTWISDRGDLLAAFFALTSFLAYLFYKQHSKFLYLLASLFSYVCALFTKESAVAVPLIILCYEFYRSNIKPDKEYKLLKSLAAVLLYSLPFILYLLARYFVLGDLIGGYGRKVHLNFDFLLIAKNLWIYPARLLLPPLPNIGLIFSIITTFIALIIIGMKFILKKELSSIIYFLIFAFYILLLPVSNLVISYFNSEGERFIYFPSVFFIMSMAVLLYYVFTNPKAFVVVSLGLILFCQLSLYQVNKNWREAGEISKNIIYSIKQLEKADRLLIVSLPDNINGAYIFRNGLQDAIHLFIGQERFKSIAVISRCDIFSENDGVKIVRDALGYSVQLISSRGCLNEVLADYGSNITCRGFSLDFKKLDIDDKVIFYAVGKMEELNL
jgi:hypothetical protein